MNNQEAIDALSIKLKVKTGSSLFSIESLSNEYSLKFPQDVIGNNILRNYLRKCELGLNITHDLEFLNKHFS